MQNLVLMIVYDNNQRKGKPVKVAENLSDGDKEFIENINSVEGKLKMSENPILKFESDFSTFDIAL